MSTYHAPQWKVELKQWLIDQLGNGRCCACVGCGRRLTLRTITLDRYPIRGADGGQYVQGNVRPMCGPCNNNHVFEPGCDIWTTYRRRIENRHRRRLERQERAAEPLSVSLADKLREAGYLAP